MSRVGGTFDRLVQAASLLALRTGITLRDGCDDVVNELEAILSSGLRSEHRLWPLLETFEELFDDSISIVSRFPRFITLTLLRCRFEKIT